VAAERRGHEVVADGRREDITSEPLRTRLDEGPSKPIVVATWGPGPRHISTTRTTAGGKGDRPGARAAPAVLRYVHAMGSATPWPNTLAGMGGAGAPPFGAARQPRSGAVESGVV